MDAQSEDSDVTRDLLARLRNGEPDAFEQLLARYRTRLEQVIRVQLDPKLGARLDASDIVQETELEAARRVEDFLARQPMPFRVWLRKMAHERLLRARRRHLGAARRAAQRQVPLPNETSLEIIKQLIGRTGTPSQHLNCRDLAQRVRHALTRLPRTDRQLLLMRYFEGLSYEDIGQVLEIDADTAMRRHGRALLRLHRILRDEGLTESQL